jgi:hypothetical protein
MSLQYKEIQSITSPFKQKTYHEHSPGDCQIPSSARLQQQKPVLWSDLAVMHSDERKQDYELQTS